MLPVVITYLFLPDSVWPTWWETLPIIVLDLVCSALSGSRCVLTYATEVCKCITLIIIVCWEVAALNCGEFSNYTILCLTYCNNSETRHLLLRFHSLFRCKCTCDGADTVWSSGDNSGSPPRSAASPPAARRQR